MEFMNIKETVGFLDIALKHNIVPLLMGSTGVGKTEAVEQYTKEHGMDLIVLHVAQLEPSDFIGLYQIENRKTINCQPSWLPDADKFNKNGGIIFLDEINRGHEDIRQALMQFITTKTIHTYKLPDNYHIVCAANPSGDYEVYEFDKALKNRFAWIKFKPSFDETISYLGSKYGKHNPILMWVSSDKALIEYGDNFDIDKLQLTPRFTEKAIQIYGEIKGLSKEKIRKYLSTIIDYTKVQSFISYLEELETVSYKDILKGDNMDKVSDLLARKRIDVIATLATNLSDHFRDRLARNTKQTDYTKFYSLQELINTTDFLDMIPDEIAFGFVDNLKSTYTHPCSITKQEYFITKLKGKFTYAKDAVLEAMNGGK